MRLSAYDRWKLQTPEEAGYYKDEEDEGEAADIAYEKERDDALTEEDE